MSAYCLDCGKRTERSAGGTLVIRHAVDCPNRKPPVGPGGADPKETRE